MSKLLYRVERLIGSQWKLCGIYRNPENAIKHCKMLGKDTRIVTVKPKQTELLVPKTKKHTHVRRLQIPPPCPLYISTYIVKSIQLCGDISLAYDLLEAEIKKEKLNNTIQT